MILQTEISIHADMTHVQESKELSAQRTSELRVKKICELTASLSEPKPSLQGD